MSQSLARCYCNTRAAGQIRPWACLSVRLTRIPKRRRIGTSPGSWMVRRVLDEMQVHWTYIGPYVVLKSLCLRLK